MANLFTPPILSRASRRGGFACALVAALCWGSATVMSKAALAGFDPIPLLVVQLTASVVCLWAVVWLRRPVSVDWGQVIGFAWLGLLEPGLAYLLGLTGLADTAATGATLIQSSESIMIVVASAVLLRERPSKVLLLLSALALCGLMLVLGAPSTGAGGVPDLSAKLWIFAGVVAAAIYVVMSGRFASQADPIFIVATQQTVALVFAVLMLCIQWAVQGSVHLAPQSPALWVIAAASGVVQYALAFSLYMFALKMVSANLAGSVLNLIPLFGLAGAFLFLGEGLSPVQLAGASLTIISVSLTSLVKAPAVD